jgi:hypothetical protein
VLHEAGERHAVLTGELGDPPVAFSELLQHVAPGAVGERGEKRVEVVV